MGNEVVSDNTAENFNDMGCKSYRTVVCWIGFTVFFVYWGDDLLFILFGYVSLLE